MLVRACLGASTDGQVADSARTALDAFAQERGLQSATRCTEDESGAKLRRPERFRPLAEGRPGDVLLIEQVDRLSRLTEVDGRRLRAEIDARQVRIVALDLPTSWSLAKAAGRCRGRTEDRKRDDGIAAMLRAGSSWQQVRDIVRCSSATVARVRQRLGAGQAA